MTDHLSEEDILAAVPGLTRARLSTFIETSVVIPLRQETEEHVIHFFRPVDLARVQLLCDLVDTLDLNEASLDVVITLIDKLHAARNDLCVLARAVQSESQDVRARIGFAIIKAGG